MPGLLRDYYFDSGFWPTYNLQTEMVLVSINQERGMKNMGLITVDAEKMYSLRELSGGMPFPFAGNEDKEFSSHPKGN